MLIQINKSKKCKLELTKVYNVNCNRYWIDVFQFVARGIVLCRKTSVVVSNILGRKEDYILIVQGELHIPIWMNYV